MIKLSERLKIIAEEIHKGETMADIGTDHGYLPLYLFTKGICPKIIMADVSPGSLAKARENAVEILRDRIDPERVDFRLGNGLEVLEPGEAGVVVIAGMGGLLISDILGADTEMSGSIGRFILQPRNGQGKLRYWLAKNGYEITAEHLAKEGRFLCEILVTHKNKTPLEMMEGSTIKPDLPEWSEEEAIQYEVPESLLHCPEKELIVPFIKNRIRIEKTIMKDLSCSKDPALSKIGITEKRIEYLEELLEKAADKERQGRGELQ